MSDRTTLKTFFETDDFPTQSQFADLIDSLAHLLDDLISQADAEAGTSTAPKTWTAERVAQAIAAQGGSALTASQELAFNKADPKILFNSNKSIYSLSVIDQEVTVLVDLTDAKNSFEAMGEFKGDGVNDLILGNFVNDGILTYDKSLDVVNVIVFFKSGQEFKYRITSQYTEDTTPPVLQSAVVRKGTDNTIELLYPEALDNTSTPATTDYVVKIDAASQTTSSVTIVGNQVNVVIGASVLPGEVVTISYTSGANPIQDLVGNDAVNLVDQAVTNQTQDILGITNLQGYWVAESAADFTLSTLDVLTWIDRSVNARTLAASGGGNRTFDSVLKAVVSGSTTGQYLNFSPLLNLGTEYTIVLYENYTYRNTTTTFNSEDGAIDYIGESSGSRFQHSSDAGVDQFDQGTLPAGIKKHVIRRNAGNLKWELNGVALVHSTDVMTGNPTAAYRTEGLGFSGFLNEGPTHAWVIFNRELTDSEINDTVLAELNGILGI